MIDLENFPTNSTARRMLDSVSPIYDRSYVGKWIFEVMGFTLTEVQKYVSELPYQIFVDTATWGIRYFEIRYRIPENSNLSLEERRQRIKARTGQRGSMTPARIENIIKDVFGITARVEEYPPSFCFQIILQTLPGQVDEENFSSYINRVKPSHMSYSYSYEQGTSGGIFIGGTVRMTKSFMMRQVN